MKSNIFFIALIGISLWGYRADAQNEVRYAQGIFRPELINPAYKWQEGKLELDAVYRFPWEKDQSPEGGIFNLHSNAIGKDLGIGLKGDFYSTSSVRSNNQIGITLDYGWNFSEGMTLKIGAGAGVNMERYHFGHTDPDFQSALRADDYNENRFYAEIGVAFKYTNLCIGVSGYSCFDDDYMVLANARYNWDLGEKWQFSPLVSYTSYQDFDDLFDAGATVSYRKLFEIGVAYSTNSEVNLMAHVNVCKRFNVYYNCGLAVGDSSDLYGTVHEIGIKLLLW